ncbi:MAG TPA: glycosyltransferase [Terriglobia bacterium]|nr:glycosyltransferase [Terriglobia bacterium]
MPSSETHPSDSTTYVPIDKPWRRYRVLVVTNLWPTKQDPGWGSFVQAQMESLRPHGVEYDVLFMNGRESYANYVKAVFELQRRLTETKYDLIHAHFGLSGLVARAQWRVPVVVSFMGDDVLGQFDREGRNSLVGLFYQLSSFALARCVSAVIVKSEQMKQRLRLSSGRVIPNGVNLDLFRPIDRGEARRVLGLDDRRKYVLFPYDPSVTRKRFDLLQEAVKLARAQLPELEILRVVGVPRPQMPLYFNAAEVLVLLSYGEGSPNAVKEAMAVNLPVITVDVGDSRDLIGRTEGCHLVSPRADEIAARIIDVCRRGTRTKGREWIARYSEETIAREVFDVYASVVG